MTKEDLTKMFRAGMQNEPTRSNLNPLSRGEIRFEVSNGVVYLYVDGKQAGTLSFGDIESIHFAVQTHKKLRGYPEPVPTHP